MRDYDVHGWDDHHFRDLPKGARGIDPFIGDPGRVGPGHGSGFIAARLRSLFDAGAPVIATDPHLETGWAIAVYGKVGFDVAGLRRETDRGSILPMQARR